MKLISGVLILSEAINSLTLSQALLNNAKETANKPIRVIKDEAANPTKKAFSGKEPRSYEYSNT